MAWFTIAVQHAGVTERHLFELDRPVRIGRRRDIDIVLADSMVARIHAKLEHRDSSAGVRCQGRDRLRAGRRVAIDPTADPLDE